MEIRYDTDRLTRILQGLSALTGLTLGLWDDGGNYLCGCSRPGDFCSRMQQQEGKTLCAQCDTRLVERCKKSGQVESHHCHMGLFDLALPIRKNGVPVGHLVMGRVRSPKSPQESPIPGLQALYEQTPRLDMQQIESIITLLPEILFERAIEWGPPQGIEAVAAAIERDLQADLSVDALCARFFLSKNALYKGFRAEFGCTVNEYVTAARLKEAKKLLRQTDAPVYSVAARVGIENYTYFCKLFKKHIGCSQMEYRKKDAR